MKLKLQYFNDTKELIEFAKKYELMWLLYDITRIIAETDSIGEDYGEGPKEYTRERFDEEVENMPGIKDGHFDGNYLWSAGIYVLDEIMLYRYGLDKVFKGEELINER